VAALLLGFGPKIFLPLRMTDDELIDYQEQRPRTRQRRQKPKTYAAAQFKDFLLRDELNKAIKEAAFEHPSEVQQMCIPKAILGQDILCQAKSGTGKTAVFVLSTLQQLRVVEKETSIVVVVHTKEMAEQVKYEYLRFSKMLDNVTVAAFYGGTNIKENISQLAIAAPTVVIATPGRLSALVRYKDLSLKHVQFFVIDECDNIVDRLRMRYEVQSVFVKTPRKKQTMMFTATLNERTKQECMRFLDNPFEVKVDEESKLTLYGLKQMYAKVTADSKDSVLEAILNNTQYDQAVVFVGSKESATRIAAVLNAKSFPTVEIHSALDTEKRKERLQGFKDFQYRVLVTTDLMSRGIDIQRINLVINYDMPDGPETYLHRVGRAGRFETEGTSITFVGTEEDTTILNEIQSRFEVSLEETAVA
jgi:ATP-dependent RNA helicase UAP56/SUB2